MIHRWFDVANPVSFFEQAPWRPMYLVMAVPALAYAVLLIWVPESPRWYRTKGRVEKSEQLALRCGVETNSAPLVSTHLRQLLTKKNLPKLLVGLPDR